MTAKRGPAFKHGKIKSPEYKAWNGLKERCLCKTHCNYNNYGGRGINVCPRWLKSFENFYEDMGNKPIGTSLDRIDNDKGYSKSNCRWASASTQSGNRRSNVTITWKDMSLNVIDWAAALEVPAARIYARLKRGYNIEDTLFKPKDNRGHR